MGVLCDGLQAEFASVIICVIVLEPGSASFPQFAELASTPVLSNQDIKFL